MADFYILDIVLCIGSDLIVDIVFRSSSRPDSSGGAEWLLPQLWWCVCRRCRGEALPLGGQVGQRHREGQGKSHSQAHLSLPSSPLSLKLSTLIFLLFKHCIFLRICNWNAASQHLHLLPILVVPFPWTTCTCCFSLSYCLRASPHLCANLLLKSVTLF